jgi:hypothetical protein
MNTAITTSPAAITARLIHAASMRLSAPYRSTLTTLPSEVSALVCGVCRSSSFQPNSIATLIGSMPKLAPRKTTSTADTSGL